MKDNLKMSRKQLKALANNLEAVPIANDIYRYEKALSELVSAYCNQDETCTYQIIAYSAGIYGNSGRIDKILFYDNDIPDVYVCWY